ncbi:MAG: J domain-containing protein, partial [Burkholderiaceae bacterium]|nr:J domain-containing protein [Burkholderiaceae bacterium]
MLNQVQNQQNYYAILKVAQDAPVEVIRAAYKTLSQKCHPDRNPDTPDANQMMVQLNIAYQHLSDP